MGAGGCQQQEAREPFIRCHVSFFHLKVLVSGHFSLRGTDSEQLSKTNKPKFTACTGRGATYRVWHSKGHKAKA